VNINVLYPSLLALIPTLMAPLFLLFKSKKAQKLIVMVIVTLNAILIALLSQNMPVDEYTGGWLFRGVHLRFDGISLIFTSLFITVMGISWLSSFRKDYPPLFYFLTSVLLATLNTAAVSLDLFNIYVILELSSIIAYILIALKHKWTYMWVSLKYLIISYFAFTMYLIGTGLVYMTNGTFDMSRLSQNVPPIILAMLIIPVMLKTGLFPISMWLPSVHSLAKTEISAILSGSFVNMGIIILFRLLNIPIMKHLQYPVTVIAIASMIAAAIFSYHEENAKRILAFSTMSQMGYILVGGPLYGSIHAFNHGISKALLFIVVGDQVEETEHYSIKALRHHSFPLHRYIFLTIGILGMIGIPLTGTFISKSLLIEHTNLIGKLALIFASIITTASLIKIWSIGFIKSKITIYIPYLVPSIIIFGSGILLIKGSLSILHIIEVLLIILVSVLLFKFYKPSTLPRTLEKLDVMIVVYMITLFVVWLILTTL